MRFSLLLAAVLAFSPLLAAGSAAASAPKAEKAAEEGGNDRAIISPNIVTPVVRDGKLVNYLFVTVQVDMADGANALKLRDRAHFLRDALLRATHRVSLVSPERDDRLNVEAALPVLRAAAAESLGAENIRKVSVTGVDSLRRF